MTRTPDLVDGDLRLTRFTDRHLTAAYVAWLNDPAAMRFSEQRHRSHTLESCAAYARQRWDGPDHFWAIEVSPLGHVGNMTATLDPPNLVADLAIVIGDASARGRGVGRRAWGLALDWLLGDGGMRKVTAGTMATNQAMIGVMRRHGMVEEGRRRGQFLLDGIPVDLVQFARFRPPPAAS